MQLIVSVNYRLMDGPRLFVQFVRKYIRIYLNFLRKIFVALQVLFMIRQLKSMQNVFPIGISKGQIVFIQLRVFSMSPMILIKIFFNFKFS
jgi:hypothetical protein